MRTLLLFVLLATAMPTVGAPQLSEPERDQLADETSDGDVVLDQQDGLYVLLRNASSWQADDFGGEGGAAVAPPPDYDFLKANPGQVRGNVFVIEGWLAQHDRFPSLDNHGRDELVRAGHPDWGDQVTRWTVVTAKGDKTATVIVLFNDPRGQMPQPAAETKVRIAARFYKLWTVNDADGNPFTYAVFVGGAHEVVVEPTGPGGVPMRSIIFGMVVLGAVAFFIVRLLLSRREGGGSMMRQRLIELRQKREQDEALEEEGDEQEPDDLPDDPIAALDVLRDRHRGD